MRTHSHVRWGQPCSQPSQKACNAAYHRWQARSQVLLAERIVAKGHANRWRHDQTQFGQLVKVVAGEQEDILNEDRNPSEAPFVKLLREAISRRGASATLEE